MLNKEPSLTRRQAIYRSLAGVFLYISVASQRAEACVLDMSGAIPMSCSGVVPEFETPTATADGFTVQVSNYDSDFTWSVSTTAGSATISVTGLITVTGLTPGESAVVTVFTSSWNYTTEQADVSGSAKTGSALTSTFETPTATADGFTVQVNNYDSDFTWSVSTTAGSVTISVTGLITVTGLTPGESAVVTVANTRTGYNAGTLDVSGSAKTGSALTSTFETPTATADGFTVQVSNYDSDFTWSVSTTAGSVTISVTGLITVTGLTPGESAVVNVANTRTGYNAGTLDVSGSAAAAPPKPIPSLPVWGVAALSGMLMILVKRLNKK